MLLFLSTLSFGFYFYIFYHYRSLKGVFEGLIMDYDKIKELTKEKKVLITDHAWEAIDKREISTKEVISVILNGEIIEE